MLEITIPEQENYDEATQKFYLVAGATVQLEHSLASMSKWERVWEKPFLSHTPHTTKETNSYIECMCLNKVPEGFVTKLTPEDKRKIADYIDATMTATWFTEVVTGPPKREIITAEIMYFWLVTLTIPFEVQYWHLNSMLALVKTVNLKNQPPKKMSTSDAAARRQALNAQRKAQYGTTG